MRKAVLFFLTFGALATFCLAARDANAQQPAACTTPKTTCSGANGYYAPKEDIDRLTAVSDPILRELRTCLDGAGGKQVTPALSIRWDSDGNPVSVKIEAPGYETLPCVARASSKLASLQNPRETAIRCEFGCGKPAPPPPPTTPPPPPPPPPPPAPIVIPAPTQAQAQPAPQATQPAPAPGVVMVAPPVAGARPAEQGKYEKVWYGWQILIVDGIAFPITLAGGFTGTPAVTATGVLGFVLGAPIVHFVHQEVGRGFGSMGMRIGLPLLGAGIGAIVGLADRNARAEKRIFDNDDPEGTGAAYGALIGGAICTIIDVAAVSFKTEKVENPSPPPASSTSPQTITWRPVVHTGRDRASIGIGGTF